MLEAIRQLLILQDRDRQIHRVLAQSAGIAPERESLQAKAAHFQTSLEAARLKVKQIETERKKLELDVEAQKQLIEKYSLQQFQTKKNDEYRALAHEIEQCRATILKVEDQQLELMEQGEAAQKEAAAIQQAATEIKKMVDAQLVDLAVREENLKTQLEELQSSRGTLADSVDERYRLRYERLLKNKGDSAIVGIEHGVCGGCHMKLLTQTIVTCQGEEELVACINCGRMLYYTQEMDLTVAD
ncbi:MAG: zinc ribbon domain-containing protein [Limisphaerales bacterium]